MKKEDLESIDYLKQLLAQAMSQISKLEHEVFRLRRQNERMSDVMSQQVVKVKVEGTVR